MNFCFNFLGTHSRAPSIFFLTGRKLKTPAVMKKPVRRRPAKKFLKPAAVSIPIIILVFSVCVSGIIYLNEAPERAESTASVKIEGGEVLLEIAAGESAASAGERLREACLIKNKEAWDILYSAGNRFGKKYIKAGMYRFQTGLSLLEIYGILTEGQLILIKVTIPEGSTIKKTSRILEAGNICAAEDFQAAARSRELLEKYRIPGESLEGYLYPDTYFWTAHYPAALVAENMADNFFRTIERINKADKTGAGGGDKTVDGKETPDDRTPGDEAPGPEELYKRVIIASIIEREYRLPEEAPVMAGVFYNRLNRGMRLESCASVEYIITEIEGKAHPARIFNADLEIDNPYNTYLYKGLPPGPISSPGETALRAAFNPEKNDFYFFRIVDAGAGRHYFSKTFDAHIKAAALLVK